MSGKLLKMVLVLTSSKGLGFFDMLRGQEKVAVMNRIFAKRRSRKRSGV